jgi:hypothetical protein
MLQHVKVDMPTDLEKFQLPIGVHQRLQALLHKPMFRFISLQEACNRFFAIIKFRKPCDARAAI